MESEIEHEKLKKAASMIAKVKLKKAKESDAKSESDYEETDLDESQRQIWTSLQRWETSIETRMERLLGTLTKDSGWEMSKKQAD